MFFLENGVPYISKAAAECIPELYSEFAKPVFPPSTDPLRDWTDWRTGGYWDEDTLSAPFIRRDDKHTEERVRQGFRDGSMKQHVDGVNALQRVPWTINTRVLAALEWWAPLAPRLKRGSASLVQFGEKLIAEETLAADLQQAKDLGGDVFRIPHSCDARGRAYGISHFNFARSDHVRASRKKPRKTRKAAAVNRRDLVVRKKVVVLTPEEALREWWLARGLTRSIVKRPAMTYAYSATLSGMGAEVAKHLKELGCNDWRTDRERADYLAKLIMAACKDVLVRPTEIMKYLRKLAAYRAKLNQPFEWTTPTGFPWSSTYFEQKHKSVDLWRYGERFSHQNVVVGETRKVWKAKLLNAAAPNFVHAMDACHLMRVTNAAVEEGITSIVGVHDCFGCLATRASRFHRIIRAQFALLYMQYVYTLIPEEKAGVELGRQVKHRGVLASLRAAALGPAAADEARLPIPPAGSLNIYKVQNSEYPFA